MAPQRANSPASDGADVLSLAFQGVNLNDSPSYDDRDGDTKTFICADDGFPPEPIKKFSKSSKWYVVIAGYHSGIFEDYASVAPLVNQFAGNVHQRADTWSHACRIWFDKCLDGEVRGPLHSDSVIGKVLSYNDYFKWLDRLADNPQHSLVAPSVALSPPPPTLRSTLPSTTSGSSIASSPQSSSNKLTSRALSSLSSTIVSVPNTVYDMVSVPNTVYDDGEYDNASEFDPVITHWVVIKGARPGIYVDESEFREALGPNKQSQGMTFFDEKSAQLHFARNASRLKEIV